jgi:hypothetical protein
VNHVAIRYLLKETLPFPNVSWKSSAGDTYGYAHQVSARPARAGLGRLAVAANFMTALRTCCLVCALFASAAGAEHRGEERPEISTHESSRVALHSRYSRPDAGFRHPIDDGRDDARGAQPPGAQSRACRLCGARSRRRKYVSLGSDSSGQAPSLGLDQVDGHWVLGVFRISAGT